MSNVDLAPSLLIAVVQNASLLSVPEHASPEQLNPQRIAARAHDLVDAFMHESKVREVQAVIANIDSTLEVLANIAVDKESNPRERIHGSMMLHAVAAMSLSSASNAAMMLAARDYASLVNRVKDSREQADLDRANQALKDMRSVVVDALGKLRAQAVQ